MGLSEKKGNPKSIGFSSSLLTSLSSSLFTWHLFVEDISLNIRLIFRTKNQSTSHRYSSSIVYSWIIIAGISMGYAWDIAGIPSGKQTWHWKMDHLSMIFLSTAPFLSTFPLPCDWLPGGMGIVIGNHEVSRPRPLFAQETLLDIENFRDLLAMNTVKTLF